MVSLWATPFGVSFHERGPPQTSRLPVPSWDLLLVLDALFSHPFEPTEVAELTLLTIKLSLLIALTTAK